MSLNLRMPLIDRVYWGAVGVSWLVICIKLSLTTLATVDAAQHPIALPFELGLQAVLAAMLSGFFFALPLKVVFNLLSAERRRTHRRQTFALTLAFALPVGLAAEALRETAAHTPPDGVTTLAAFIERMPAPTRVHAFRSGGKLYIAWTTKSAGPLDITSGPPCYMFNERGDLELWVAQTGEGTEVDKLLGTAQFRRELTVEQALGLTRSAAN